MVKWARQSGLGSCLSPSPAISTPRLPGVVASPLRIVGSLFKTLIYNLFELIRFMFAFSLPSSIFFHIKCCFAKVSHLVERQKISFTNPPVSEPTKPIFLIQEQAKGNIHLTAPRKRKEIIGSVILRKLLWTLWDMFWILKDKLIFRWEERVDDSSTHFIKEDPLSCTWEYYR